MDIKKCTKCGENKELTCFYKRSAKSYRSECKDCIKKMRKETHRVRFDSDPEYKKWFIEQSRKFHERHKNDTNYRKRKSENTNNYRNKKANDIDFKNKEKKRQVVWAKNNRNKVRAKWNRYEARRRLLPDNLESTTWIDILENKFNGKCALTGSSSNIHMEHFIPLRIGHGGTYLGNVYPMEGTLNSSKCDANPFEWVKREDVKYTIDMLMWERLIVYLAKENKLSVDEFREFVYWCFENPRTINEIKDAKEKTSLEMWKER